MRTHFIHTHHVKVCLDLFILRVSLWSHQVIVEIASHQKLCPKGLLSDGSDDTLYG